MNESKEKDRKDRILLPIINSDALLTTSTCELKTDHLKIFDKLGGGEF